MFQLEIPSDGIDSSHIAYTIATDGFKHNLQESSRTGLISNQASNILHHDAKERAERDWFHLVYERH
jgi:hypothetical protein